MFVEMYFEISWKYAILNYNWINNHTQIKFKNEICNKVVSKNRTVKSTN